LVLPFQPFDAYPDVLGAADVLVAVLERDAGKFSVPSKILSYLCAARPIVLSAPGENLASRTIERAGAGIAVPAGDGDAFVDAVKRMLSDAGARTRAGEAAYRYAMATFDIRRIADRFEAVFAAAQRG